MPICKREGFDNAEWNDKNETFQDHEKVFCCLITKRIFRDYEKYFRHMMVINSTVWQCEATGQDNLTYEEALKSERAAYKKMEQFKDSLRPPVMLVIEHAKQSAIKTLNIIVTKFLRKRYFLNEEVTVSTQKKPIAYKVVAILPPNNEKPNPNEVYEDTDKLQYRLRPVSGDADAEITVPFEQVRRQRLEFTVENLQMFLKNNIARTDGILHPKPESYKQYVTSRKITFASIFIGRMPHYTPAKIKRPDPKDKKQPSINKYLVKNGEASKCEKFEEKTKQTKADKAKEAEAKAKSLKEEMERMRIEKLEKLAEKERAKAEVRAKLMERIEAECTELLTKTDDLERSDQRLLPLYTPIRTYMPDKLLGDAFMLREFMHSFSGILSGIEVFRNNLSFYEMSRAFTAREVAGPLSDIFLVLLGTIFDLQREEEEECGVQYITGRMLARKDREPFKTMGDCARTHFYAMRHFSFRINELPLDALTLSEVLRLHLLSSGALVKDKAEKWRIMYRNGYASVEDPGLSLRMQHSHILRSLKIHPIYQFPFKDIMRVVRCLMSQIMTYSGAINIIEERMEETAKAKTELRTLILAENRRLAAVEQQKRKMTNEHNQQCMYHDVRNDVGKKQQMLEKLNKKIAELLAQSDRERRKHDQQVEKLNSALFNFLAYLGMDRAYRKYYVLESIPGIFVEHPPDSMDTCLENPPQNEQRNSMKATADLPRNRKDLRAYLLKMYKDETVEKADVKTKKLSQENKENQEHHLNGLNDSTNAVEKIDSEGMAPTQYQLYMCTGDSRNCIVHDERNAERQRWAYLYKTEDINALIESLNPLGMRESELRSQLVTLQKLIENHVKNCPFELLTIESDKGMQKFRDLMMMETHRKYGKANFGIALEGDLNDIICVNLIDRILQFETDIYTGDLGRLKVKDMEKWRTDLLNNAYEPQCKLQWGTSYTMKQLTGEFTTPVNSDENMDGGDIDEEDEGVELDEDANDMGGKFANKPYRDPGYNLGPAIEIDSEDSAEEELPLLESETLRVNVRNLASALLQVEQAIERRFLKEPFGVSNTRESKERLELKQRFGTRRLKQWEISLMESTSYSQVFLHLNILHDCIIWARSTNKSYCQVCRRGSDPEKMLLCDECNGGTHMFCMKPKMKTVPEGNWYCIRCVTRLGMKNPTDDAKKKATQKRKRKFIVEEPEEVAEDEEDNNDEDEENDYDDDEELAGVDDDKSETWSVSSRPKAKVKVGRPRGRPSNKRLKSKEIEEALASSDDDDVEAEDGNNEAACTNSGDEEVAGGAEETQENDSSESEEDGEEEEENVCAVCSYDGSDLSCARCKDCFHLECVSLKRPPRSEYVCPTCKQNESKKTKSRHNRDNSDEDEDSDEPRTKRSRTSRTSLRNSLNGITDRERRSSNNNNNNNNNNNHRRSNRRTNEDLPLNSSALYELLEQTMKHKLSWPFLRPVTQSEVPDYHKIIKTPMDLAKVKSKLNMGKYQLNEEVLKDIQLIFHNCHEYNEENNEIYEAGCALERFVIDCCKDLHLPFKPSEMNA